MVVLTAVLLASAGCSSVAPDAGQEAVLVRKPMFIGHGGVDPEPIRTGLKYVAWTTSAVYVGMTPKQQEVAFDDLFTADGVPLDFHTAVQYRVTDSVKLVSKFGADDGPHGMGFFVRNLQQPYGQIVRDSVKKHGLNEMAINASAAEEVDGEVTARFKALVQQLDVPIEVIGISLGRANPPDAIKHQRIATAEQI